MWQVLEKSCKIDWNVNKYWSVIIKYKLLIKKARLYILITWLPYRHIKDFEIHGEFQLIHCIKIVLIINRWLASDSVLIIHSEIFPIAHHNTDVLYCYDGQLYIAPNWEYRGEILSPRYPLRGRVVFMGRAPFCRLVGPEEHFTGAIPLSCQKQVLLLEYSKIQEMSPQ